MTDNDQILEKASRILDDFDIGPTIVLLASESWRFQSTPDVKFFNRRPELEVPSELDNWAAMKCDGQEIVVGWGKFRSSYAPDDASSYADAYVYFNGELVLHTGANSEYTEWGSRVSVNTYAFSLKVFKAGPWIDLLGKCAGLLESDHKRREEEKRQEKVAEQASNIDLGDYE